VVAANAQARRILGADVVGRLLAELVVDFTDLPEQSGQGTHLLSLNTVSGMPESYHFRRFALSDGTLALGSPDFQERDRLSTEVLGLNRELNDLTPPVAPGECRIARPEPAQKPVPRHGGP
jgi:hypothetical protein